MERGAQPHRRAGRCAFHARIRLELRAAFRADVLRKVSVGQQFFLYNRFSDLDFGSFDLRAGVSYILPSAHNLLLRADYAYNRVTKVESFDAFFVSHAIVLGAELPFRIGRAQQSTAGTDLMLNIAADPDQPARHDFSAFVAYSVNLTRALNANVVGRVAVRD